MTVTHSPTELKGKYMYFTSVLPAHSLQGNMHDAGFVSSSDLSLMLVIFRRDFHALIHVCCSSIYYSLYEFRRYSSDLSCLMDLKNLQYRKHSIHIRLLLPYGVIFSHIHPSKVKFRDLK